MPGESRVFFRTAEPWRERDLLPEGVARLLGEPCEHRGVEDAGSYGHDPDYGFGLPVVWRSGVRTEIVAERFRAGDTRQEIAYDFGISPAEVEAAVRYELPDPA